MFKNHYLLFLCLVFIFTGCSKEKEPTIIDLTLDQAKVSLLPGKSISVTIETGNGGYTATSSNKDVATATISEDVVTITATTNEDRANAVIIITDKMFKRKNIEVDIAKVFDLALDINQASLEVGVEDKNEVVVKVSTGNFGYKAELLDDSDQYISLDISKLESHGKFTVKAIAAGSAKVKITDAKGKETILEITVTSPDELVVDKKSILLNAVQASDVIIVSAGNGDYKAEVANENVAKVSVNGDEITVTGKTNGVTTLTITDKKAQQTTVDITVNGPKYAMNLSDQYFAYANFSDIAVVDNSIKSLKQVTFELTCKIDGYRGLQTFMGLENGLIIRGKNDDYRAAHPIQIAGLGDKIMLESTSSFNLNEWINIALVVDCTKDDVKDKYKLYINGVEDVLIVTREEETHSVVNLASSSDGNRFQIGRSSGQDWRVMRGAVSEARVWTVARTGQQIKDNMCDLDEESRTGLLARWDFSAGTDTDYIQDSNGGKYETNLIIANAKIAGNYTPVIAPKSTFIEKGCPN